MNFTNIFNSNFLVSLLEEQLDKFATTFLAKRPTVVKQEAVLHLLIGQAVAANLSGDEVQSLTDWFSTKLNDGGYQYCDPSAEHAENISAKLKGANIPTVPGDWIRQDE